MPQMSMNHEPHPTPQKVEIVKELADLLKRGKGIYLADFTGLNVEKANELRRGFRDRSIIYRVEKNTLIRQACRDLGYDDLIPFLEGPTALAVSFDDAVLPVRFLGDFVKEMEKPTPIIKAGLVEERFVSAADIALLKDIPSREVLLAQILASLQAPLVNIVMVFNEVVRSFLSVLQAVIEKKRASGEGEAPPTQ